MGEVLLVLAEAGCVVDLETWSDERIAYMLESFGRLYERRKVAAKQQDSNGRGNAGDAKKSGLWKAFAANPKG